MVTNANSIGTKNLQELEGFSSCPKCGCPCGIKDLKEVIGEEEIIMPEGDVCQQVMYHCPSCNKVVAYDPGDSAVRLVRPVPPESK